MASREVELKASHDLRNAVLKFQEDMDIKGNFSVSYNHKYERIGIGGVSIMIGKRELRPLKNVGDNVSIKID